MHLSDYPNRKNKLMRCCTIILFIVVFSILSCKKTSVEIKQNSMFPNSVGTYWKYAVVDYFNNRIDTLTIKIVDTATIDNGVIVTIWQRNSHFDGTDSIYVSTKDTSAVIYFDKHAYSFKKYEFPLNVGSSWRNQNISDTSKVISISDIKTSAGLFPNSYKIVRDFKTLPGYHTTYEEEWFAPGAGIISRTYQEDGQVVPINRKYELIYFQD